MLNNNSILESFHNVTKLLKRQDLVYVKMSLNYICALGCLNWY